MKWFSSKIYENYSKPSEGLPETKYTRIKSFSQEICRRNNCLNRLRMLNSLKFLPEVLGRAEVQKCTQPGLPNDHARLMYFNLLPTAFAYNYITLVLIRGDPSGGTLNTRTNTKWSKGLRRNEMLVESVVLNLLPVTSIARHNTFIRNKPL
jgi:hypothetical protein